MRVLQLKIAKKNEEVAEIRSGYFKCEANSAVEKNIPCRAVSGDTAEKRANGDTAGEGISNVWILHQLIGK